MTSPPPPPPRPPRPPPPTPRPRQRLNYFLGATRVAFAPYVAASWAGMLPGTFAYVFLGSAGRAAGDAAAGGGGGGVKWALYAVGAAATVLATRVVSQAAARALEEAGGGDGGDGDSGSGGDGGDGDSGSGDGGGGGGGGGGQA